MKKFGLKRWILLWVLILLLVSLLAIPKIFIAAVKYQQDATVSKLFEDFPVTVDPELKIITENEQVNDFLASQHSLFGATVANISDFISDKIEEIVTSVANAPWYQAVASVDGRVVNIKAGMRKEQVATAFANALGWDKSDKYLFLTPAKNANLPLLEGSFIPGSYFVEKNTSPIEAQSMINDRFTNDVLAHYGSSTQAKVSLQDALTIASLIQRETVSTDGMRLISGIMWNRLFIKMNLQLDASLQYVKANKTGGKEWWPDVASEDKYLSSPYNTYIHEGLPPTPIANPSIEAILAALNPIQTPCLFYFSDRNGAFHCNVKYEDHVKMLKEYYK